MSLIALTWHDTPESDAMTRTSGSLLAGRNKAALDEHEVRRIANTFLGLDPNVAAKYDSNRSTAFIVSHDDDGSPFGEIIFGPDILPGKSTVDPNSSLSARAAAAHELSHYHRWLGKIALDEPELKFLDEALTSLDAVLRFDKHLDTTEVRQLIADAIQRIQLHLTQATDNGGG